MKNKAPLALMEQLVMILIFALTAALCLQVFVFSNSLSAAGEKRDKAMMAVQNAAEAVKLSRGNMTAMTQAWGGEEQHGAWRIAYSENWEVTASENAAFTVYAKPVEDGLPLLGTAHISAAGRDGEVIFETTVCWQEASDGETF